MLILLLLGVALGLLVESPLDRSDEHVHVATLHLGLLLDRLAEDLRPYATIEQQPKMEGRNMHMLVAPIKGAFDRQPEGDAE
jgi:hypothetical protein